MTTELTSANGVPVPAPVRRRSLPARTAGGLAGWHRPLLVFAGAQLPWALVSAAGYVLDHRLLDGDPIWAKPLKFNISFALFSFTLAWMYSKIANRRTQRVAWWAGTTGALSGTLEMGLITLQVVRGTASHFNVAGPFDTAVYGIMGIGIVFLYTATLIIGITLLRSSTITDRAVAWSLRAGLAIGVAGLSVGFLMVIPRSAQLADPHTLVKGSHSVGGDDTTGGLWFLGWNTQHGDLRIAHFVGLHALQALPLLALLLTRWGGRLRESTRVRVVQLAASGYAALTGLALWQALRGQSIVHPDALTAEVTAALAAMFTPGAARVLRRCLLDLRACPRQLSTA